MPTEEEARWAQMAGGGRAGATMAPPAMPASAPPPSMPPMDSGKKGKKEKAPKAPKAERQPRQRTSPARNNDANWVVTLDEGPSKQELEQMAAAELFAALAPSYNLLHAHVPDAASPDDAM